MKNNAFMGFEDLSKEQLWTLCMAEYNSANPIVKRLIDNFYAKIEGTVKSLTGCNTFFEVGCGAGESSRRIFKMLPPEKTIEVSDFDNRYVELLIDKKMPFKVGDYDNAKKYLIDSVLNMKKNNGYLTNGSEILNN